jgi:exosome complex protein LRP1
VFRELTRVKQYFEKIKAAETDPATTRPTVTLNKEAAGRVIKHALVRSFLNKYDIRITLTSN